MNQEIVGLVVRGNYTIAGIMITIGLYAQAIKVLRLKSASDVSLILLIALVYSELACFVYGLWIREWPLILLVSTSIPADVMLVYGYCRYRCYTRDVHKL